MYIIETEQRGLVFSKALKYIEKYHALYTVKSVKKIEKPCDVSINELNNTFLMKSDLVDLFYSDEKDCIDYALPLTYMNILKSMGINVDLIYSTCVTANHGLCCTFLPLCKEAVEEIKKISDLGL